MNRLKSFKAIVDEGSFTKAAEKLGYSQPALSHMLSSLEEELGLTLLERSRKGASLSPDGETMLPYIEHLLESYDSMISRAQHLYTLENSIIRISSFPALSSDWLPKKISQFRENYPNVDFIIRVGSHYRNKQDILSGISDIGTIYADSSSEMECEELASFPTRVVLPTEHYLASKSSLSLHDLSNEPFVLNEPADFDEVLDAFHDCKVYPNILSHIEDHHSILAMVREHLCISILPTVVLNQCDDGLITRPVEPPIYRTFYVGCKKRAHLSRAARTFLDFLLEEASKEGCDPVG